MDMVPLVGLVVFLGFICGSLLRRIAPEELALTQPYVTSFRWILGFAIAGTVLFAFRSSLQTLFILSFICGILLRFFMPVIPLFSGLLFVLATLLEEPLFILLASLLFLFHLAFGISSLQRISFSRILFFVSFFVPYLLVLFPFVTRSSLLPLLYALSAGYLVIQR